MNHRVGIIGCGNISDTYLEVNAKFASLEVVAVADTDTTKRDAQAAKYGVQALEIDALLASDVDVIVNLTPPAAHASVTMRALEAGKHVYSEKPLAVRLEDGWAIRESAAQKGLRVGCAPDTFLGAGGLVRAYASTASETLRAGVRLEIHPRVALLIAFPFEQMNALCRLLEGYDIQGREERFTADGLELRVDFRETDVSRLTLTVRDARLGRGQRSSSVTSPSPIALSCYS